ncbi:hypothetical protein Tco_0269614 [Tanacetum coccineum]
MRISDHRVRCRSILEDFHISLPFGFARIYSVVTNIPRLVVTFNQNGVERVSVPAQSICDKGKGKIIMKDKKQKLIEIKEADELKQRINNVEVLFSKDSSEYLINFLAGYDPQWQFPKQTQEEELKPLDVHMQTKEEDPMPLDIVYPHPEITSSFRDTVMSDSDESGVTHTKISSPFEDVSDIGSPGVVGPEHEGLPWMLDDSYVQLLPTAASPTTQSPNYVPESDPEEDPEEDDDEDPEEDPADYPADGGVDGDDEDEPSDDDEDEEIDIKANEEEEEEHPTPTDSTVVALLAADQAPSAEETEPFETWNEISKSNPVLYYQFWSPDAEVARLLAISTPPSSPLSPWSSPLLQIPSPPLPPILSPPLSQIPSPPLPISSPVPVEPRPRLLLPIHYHTTHPSLHSPQQTIPRLHPSSGTPLLHLLSTNHREDRPEVTLPPRKRLGIALGPRYEIGESSSAAAARPAGGLRADYGFVATMDREIRCDLERDVGYGIIDSWIYSDVQAGDTNIYRCGITGRQLLAGRLNMLFRDRRAHARTARLMETEARMSREAWGRSMDVSDLART